MKKILRISPMMFGVIGMLCGCNENSQNVSQNSTKIEYTIDESDLVSGKDANHDDFSVSNVKRIANSPLEGKTIYWLGSSVTYGASSYGESMVEFLAAKTGAICKKEAVSGTTIFDDGSAGLTGASSYSRRLVNSKVFDTNEHVDAFICQISTNDALASRLDKHGHITDSSAQDKDLFDRATTLGGVEFIISYVLETWGCPVFFYSGSYFGDAGSGNRANNDPSGTNYAKLVEDVKKVVEKWQELDCDVDIIDMFNDKEFNSAVTDEYYKWCTNDPIHPKRAGYLNWWMPYFEQFLIAKI